VLMTKASYLPACYLPGVQKWRSIDDVSALSAPVLIQHGAADQLIPLAYGERLSSVMQEAGLPVTFYAVETATHNNLSGQPEYQDRINAFLAEVGKE